MSAPIAAKTKREDLKADDAQVGSLDVGWLLQKKGESGSCNSCGHFSGQLMSKPL